MPVYKHATTWWAVVLVSQERPTSTSLRTNRLDELLYEQHLSSFYHVRNVSVYCVHVMYHNPNPVCIESFS